jgi:hypothetical protein
VFVGIEDAHFFPTGLYTELNNWLRSR